MQCRILFHDRELTRFDWFKTPDSSSEESQSGSAGVDDLKAICANVARVIVFLPQQDILLTSVTMPPRASKQQLNSVAFAMEDKLAEDIEDCFFATLPQQVDHSVPVAVIEREIMENCVQLLNRQHVNASLILPQIYLCPWSNADDLVASISPVFAGYLVRYRLHEGLYCDADLLSQVLSLVIKRRSVDEGQIEIYTQDAKIEGLPNGFSVNQHAEIAPLLHSFDAQSCLNLKQKEFQTTHQWLGMVKQWKWPVAAMLLLGLTFFTNDLFELWQKDRVYSQLISQQQSLLKQHVPELSPGNQPKKQLIELLSSSQAGGGQAGFVDLLHDYSRLKSEFKNVSTNKILYQQSRLIVSLESRDLNSLELFRNKLEQSKFSAQIENVNINPEKTTGRLVMQVP